MPDATATTAAHLTRVFSDPYDEFNEVSSTAGFDRVRIVSDDSRHTVAEAVELAGQILRAAQHADPEQARPLIDTLVTELGGHTPPF